MDHFKEVDLEFVIRRCHIGADSTQAADLLAFVETEHSIERYRFWLESRFARLWVAKLPWDVRRSAMQWPWCHPTGVWA